jgi:hypothetical protein
MRTLLLNHPERTATLQVLSEENAEHDLYRQDDGDGKHPEPFQFELRARQYPTWFDLIPPDSVKFIGR